MNVINTSSIFIVIIYTFLIDLLYSLLGFIFLNIIDMNFKIVNILFYLNIVFKIIKYI